MNKLTAAKIAEIDARIAEYETRMREKHHLPARWRAGDPLLPPVRDMSPKEYRAAKAAELQHFREKAQNQADSRANDALLAKLAAKYPDRKTL